MPTDHEAKVAAFRAYFDAEIAKAGHGVPYDRNGSLYEGVDDFSVVYEFQHPDLCLFRVSNSQESYAFGVCSKCGQLSIGFNQNENAFFHPDKVGKKVDVNAVTWATDLIRAARAPV